MKLVVKTSVYHHGKQADAVAELQDLVAVDREELSAALTQVRMAQGPQWDWDKFEADLWSALDRMARE
jgi:hypothetical protein